MMQQAALVQVLLVLSLAVASTCLGTLRRLGSRPRAGFALRSSVNDDLSAFLSQQSRPWSGRWDILKRRSQIPSPEFGPREVVAKCLKALKTNDDPQLDHGSCVVLSFASPQGALKSSGLDPAQHGKFLRDTQPSLIDFSRAELVGDVVEEVQNGQHTGQVRQRVAVFGWGEQGGKSGGTIFDFYLSNVGGCWLLDHVLAVGKI